ncbi:MAG: hypothetical protein KDB80_15225 [Planctomycetes bacterium]|nr:hypothetical protein [Planctomycetota bacterium]
MGLTRFACLVLVFAACHAPESYPADGIPALGWLEGQWVGETDGGVRVEACYSSADGGMLVAATKEIGADGKVTMFDFEFFAERGGTLFLQPFPFGKRSVTFALVELDSAGRRAVFENPDHDFPRRFDYHCPSPDRLVVSLVGELNGSRERARYELTRRR